MTTFGDLCQRIGKDYRPLARIASGKIWMIALCLINQKGGCGKSSSCFHLAGALAAQGDSVLLIDVDPQGSLSQGFLGSELVENLAPEQTVASILNDEEFFSPQAVIVPTGIEGIALAPANQHLAPLNVPSPEQLGMAQFALQTFLAEQSGFDWVLMDCPPNLFRCSWVAMIAADYVLIPVPPEDFGTQGLRAVHQAIDQARRLNSKLRHLGHLVTRCDRRLLIHQAYEQQLREVYPQLVLETVIPEAAAFKVAISCRQPVEQYSPRSPAAQATRALRQEILNRIAHKRTLKVA